MSDKSKIEWCDATINPLPGCSKCSDACLNCYALKMAHRLAAMGQKPYQGLTERTKSGVLCWTGKIGWQPSALDNLSKWKRGRRVFVESMGDLFHPAVPFERIKEVVSAMWSNPQHTYQLLTKRPERMAEVFGEIKRFYKPVPNWWLGATVENQEMADKRIPVLLSIPAAVYWISSISCLTSGLQCFRKGENEISAHLPPHR